MTLRNYPGFLGYTSQGVIAIRADWPMYPEEFGAELALLWFTIFPEGTEFKKIDDIDRCKLFIADMKGSDWSNPFAEKNFHVAIWDEDLLELKRRGLINGLMSEREFFEQCLSTLPTQPKAQYEFIEQFHSTAGQDDDYTSLHISRNGIVVSDQGREHMASLLADVVLDFDVLGGGRVRHFFELGYFDTAVREACIALESRLRTLIGSKAWGVPLANEFISKLRQNDTSLESYLQVCAVNSV